MASVLGNVIQFFEKIGIYDVVLPFLLTFTIIFAILEKTKVLGTFGKEKDSKKNLNAMVAFVMGFLVIASEKILVDKILKGDPLSSIPVEFATDVVLEINLKTAREIGLVIPEKILLRADKIYQE